MAQDEFWLLEEVRALLIGHYDVRVASVPKLQARAIGHAAEL
jgi:hypothetical protein